MLPKARHLLKPFSTSTTASLTWRTQIKQDQLASQISSLLLQRRNWVPLLQNLNLSSKLTSSLFLQIIQKTQTSPEISLNFFNWAKTNLGFQPDLPSHCQIIQLSLASGLVQPVKPLLGSLIQCHPVPVLLQCLLRVCRGRDSQSNLLSLVLECYSQKGLFMEGLEVLEKMRGRGCTPSVRACSALLDSLLRENETKLAWCCYGAVIRCGVSPDRSMWSLVAQILYKNGKFERIVRLLDVGLYTSVICNLVVDFYGKSGDFGAAFDILNQMCDRKIDPGFSTYSSVLDGACKYENAVVIENIMCIMVEKKLLPKILSSEYDLVVQKLCDLGKTYAAEMFFWRARDENSGLQDATYGCMLRALSKEGRLEEAIPIYRLISERGLTVNDSSYNAFVNVLCKENQSEEACELLRDVVRRGSTPCASELSRFIASQCNRGRWREAEELLNLTLEKGLLPDSLCCCLLMGHYCSSRRIDSAMALHDKMERWNNGLDAATYNVLLKALFSGKRIEAAVRVFDYMRRMNLASSASFTIMISGLCRAKELRKAMKIHDEMLNMGLKPDRAAYKRLIRGFK
ncbi:pentatricopeptide repeat-containing protein At4g21170 [Juglans microcarpa x Juglans regia]|uniref:pentatricopeptide repeat-containing protein At4g21170 n=1 Tax=Juglans microcarpa x Juglans regia TaxID=2249226 RepID=UPI001B7D9886|nr:pentatricopeptide repeat-containing protein At4g21170 [Juglans microcarpa x Juglans regia]